MDFEIIWKVIRKKLCERRILFASLALILICETVLSLLVPEVMRGFIDGLGNRGTKWLVLCALGYCLAVLLKGGVSVLNSWLGEKAGWELCDLLRVDLFGRICSFDVQRHKTVKEGYFLERVEGDINLLTGFFSTMLIDMAGSLLMVAGVVAVFFRQFPSLGFFLLVLAAGILFLFLRSQTVIAGMWREARGAQTRVLGEFSQDVSACMDIRGGRKEEYARERLEKEFRALAQSYEKASFWGNLPSTVFYSLLNVAEGAVLLLGVSFLQKGEITLGTVYLILSYVGLLNTPFAILKEEFSKMPGVIAALNRINEVYGEEQRERSCGGISQMEDGSIRFDSVSFAYVPGEPVLRDVSFQAGKGERILIEGRTGSGKSTILQLLAGFYRPDQGRIWIGGQPADAYSEDAYRGFFYYILQTNPILEDTIKNNVTRFDERFTDEEAERALAAVHLDQWLRRQGGIHALIGPGGVSRDEAQLLAWAGAVLKRPGILLVDEFDAAIHEDTIEIIDQVITRLPEETTVFMVSHRKRSRMKITGRICMEEGRAVQIMEGEI